MRLESKYGRYGGMYIPEMMMPAMEELEAAYIEFKDSEEFNEELNHLLKVFAGRPTLLYHAEHMSQDLGCKVYLKREDLLHTGAHKINNTLGQGLLAKRMGKKEIIAETGAGQHGVATAAVGAFLNIPVKIFMGTVDIERQKMNVLRMRLFGAEVIPVESGSCTLKDAINDALRYFIANAETTYYLLGSVVGPHPYPAVVQHFQSVIGKEAKEQLMEKVGKLPDAAIACVGGGSNAIGLFDAFLKDDVQLIGVEAGGHEKKHGKTLTAGSIGVFQGSKSYVLQDEDGQIMEAHSISAGLDHPGVGPLHSHLKDTDRAEYASVTDEQALMGFRYLCRKEGILPALESSHAIAYLVLNKEKFKDKTVIINLSGRGDKDVHQLEGYDVSA